MFSVAIVLLIKHRYNGSPFTAGCPRGVYVCGEGFTGVKRKSNGGREDPEKEKERKSNRLRYQFNPLQFGTSTYSMVYCNNNNVIGNVIFKVLVV